MELKQRAAKKWLKWLCGGAFIFFLAKGLLWLSLPFIVWMHMK